MATNTLSMCGEGSIYTQCQEWHVITFKTKATNVKHKVNTAGTKCDLGDKCWSDQDGDFFTYTGSPNRTSNKDAVNVLVDAFDDLVNANAKLEEVDNDLSQDDCVKAEKQEAEQRRLRLQLMLEEENNMKSIEISYNSTHMKLALEKCRTTKRRYVNVLRTPMEVDTEIKGPSMDTLKNQKNVLDAYMIERCQDLKPWEEFLSSSGWRHCKFPWCNDVVVDRPFWDSLIGLDDNHLGWLHEEHIDLWVWYMWHFRQSCQDWSMVSCNFLTLLLRESMPLFYATYEIYPLAWRDVEQVFIPINEPNRHWSLAQFHIKSGNVTFYDSQETFDVEIRPWYVKIRRCLESKLPVVLQETGVFVSKGIDPTHYSIKFRHAQNVPKQGGVFGDCGVFVCLFLYRLAHGIPLDACIEEIIKDAKLIKIEDQLLVLIKRQVETELMLEEKFRDLCEEVSNFVKESEDVVKEVERLSCKDVVKDDFSYLLRLRQKHDLYKMTVPDDGE
ncbi:phospholipase-like protein [Tanacetum coccineum]